MMHLCGFFKEEKVFDIYFAVCVPKKKKKIPLGFRGSE